MKECPACKATIDYKSEDTVIRSTDMPVSYCMCDCGEVLVDFGPGAPLIPLDQVMSDKIREDAVRTIEDQVGDSNEREFVKRILENILNVPSGKIDFNKESLSDGVKVFEIKMPLHEMFNADISTSNINQTTKDKGEEVKKELIAENKTKEEKRLIGYVAYDAADKNILAEFDKDCNTGDIFKTMAESFGVDALRNKEVVLCELKAIEPKFKQKLIYELDI